MNTNINTGEDTIHLSKVIQAYVIMTYIPPNAISITKNGKQHVWCDVRKDLQGNVINITPIEVFLDTTK